MAPGKPSINSNGPFWHKSFTHIKQSVGAVSRKVWCTNVPSSFLNTVITSVSVASSPRSFSLTSATGQIDVHTALKYGTKPNRYVTLNFRELRCATQLRSFTEITPPQPFLCVSRSPFWYDFRGGAKYILYSANTALDCKAQSPRESYDTYLPVT